MPHYLGNPTGAGMIKLPYALRGYDQPFDRSVTATKLIAGGTAASAQLNARRTFTLSWHYLTQAEVATVLGFYSRAWGIGPYALLDTSWDNQLRLDTSLFGARRGVLTAWTPTAGTATYDSTVTAFALPSGTLRWSGAGSGSVLGEGSLIAGFIEASTSNAVPYLTDQPYTASIYARTASSTATITMRVSGRNGAQTVHVDTAGTATPITSAGWTRITATASAGTLTNAQFVIPTVLCGTASAPDILLSNPQLQLASAVTGWVPGVGVPRVLPIDTVPNPVNVIGEGRDMTMTLAEV